MKPCRIIKSFNGSQDGRFTEPFEAGTVRDLSYDLIAATINEGWIEIVKDTSPAKTVEIENKAIITEGKRKASRK